MVRLETEQMVVSSLKDFSWVGVEPMTSDLTVKITNHYTYIYTNK